MPLNEAVALSAQQLLQYQGTRNFRMIFYRLISVIIFTVNTVAEHKQG